MSLSVSSRHMQASYADSSTPPQYAMYIDGSPKYLAGQIALDQVMRYCCADAHAYGHLN